MPDLIHTYQHQDLAINKGMWRMFSSHFSTNQVVQVPFPPFYHLSFTRSTTSLTAHFLSVMLHIKRNIPDDVIRDIFGHFSSKLVTDGSSSFPWHLGHICGEWRAIFLSMNVEFWGDIVVFRHQPLSRQDYERILNIVEFFLQRGHDVPFSLQLYDTEDKIYVDRVLDMFLEHSTRWKKAKFALDVSKYPALARVKNCLPRLQHLELFINPIHRLPDFIADTFVDAPSLTSIKADCMTKWEFNWSKLTTFRLSWGLTFVDRIDTLCRMTNLEDLCIGYFELPASSPPQITLPRLRTLETYGSSLLRLLKAPELEKLAITFVHAGKALGPSSDLVASFLRRSSCTLRHLEISRCKAITIIEILPYTPHITHLQINFAENLVDVLQWLTISAQATEFQERCLPVRHLQLLEVCLYVWISGVAEALYDLVASRIIPGPNEGVERPRAVHIYALDSPTKFQRIQQLCDERNVFFRLRKDYLL